MINFVLVFTMTKAEGCDVSTKAIDDERKHPNKTTLPSTVPSCRPNCNGGPFTIRASLDVMQLSLTVIGISTRLWHLDQPASVV